MNRYTPLIKSVTTVCDIETLGLNTTTGSVILSVGLATIKNQNIIQTKEWLISLDSDQHEGFINDPSTQQWHAEKTLPEAYDINFSRKLNRVSPVQFLVEFSAYIKELNETSEMHFLVGNDASFDFEMISRYLEKFEMEIPWQYFQLLNFRTLATAFGISKETRERAARFAFAMTEQYPHNALYDAVYEAAIFVEFIEKAKIATDLTEASK